MLDRETQGKNVLKRLPVPISDPVATIKDIVAEEKYEIVSAVGHTDIARLFTHILGFIVMVNHCDFKLVPDSVAIIGQYIGPPLPEGATQLPPESTIQWWMV